MVQTREYAMTHYNMAYAWFKQKNYAGALSWFRRYVEQPHNKSEEKFVVDGQNRIGDCYFIQRDYTQAVRYYNMAAITRITSYNVCYTKLLRLPSFETTKPGRSTFLLVSVTRLFSKVSLSPLSTINKT